MIARSHQPPRSRVRRGATSLIEVVAAFSVSAVLLGTCASVMILLLRLDRLGRDELAATLAEGRLAADLRDDVGAALDLRLDPGDPSGPLELVGPAGRSASYQPRDGAIDRVRRDGDSQARLETYRLLPGTSARWEVTGAGHSRRVGLVLDAPRLPKVPEGGRRLLRIEATLGRDRRFERGDS